MIMGVGDLFMDEGKQPPENRDGSFIISDATGKPLDWNTLKDTPYVQSLHPHIQTAIEQAIAEEHLKAARPASGKSAMILDDKQP